MRVPAQAYDVSQDDIDWITGELAGLLERGDFLTMGSYVEQFEERFAHRHQRRFAAATNAGTSALEAILRALDVAGGEVVLPTNTFAATAFAVLHAGARPVFADVGADLALDPADARRRIGPNTRAVITVHIGGLVSPGIEELAALCEQRGIPLVEDAAHAHGSALHGRPAGSFGIAAAFSFFSTKVITMGEGGAVVTDDPNVDATVRLLRDQAKTDGNRHETLGHNWRLTEVQAMLGLRQLDRLDEFIERRQAIAARYDDALAGVRGLAPLALPAGAHSNFYKYVVFLDEADPEQVKADLKARHDVSLGGYVYEVPLHQQPAFRAHADGPLPVAEDRCRRHICPPIYPSLSDEAVDHVAAAIRREVGERVGAGRSS